MRIYAEFAPQGDYLALKRTGCKSIAGGKRGEIKSFSKASRSRLMKRISQVQKHKLPLFVTLTYPEEFPGDFEIYKKHLHTFFIDLRYHFPNFGAIWKLEYQGRGAAHFHILLWGCTLDQVIDLIPALWYKIAGNEDENHLKFHKGELGHGNRPCVEEVRSWNGVKSYCSKYLTKDVSMDAPSGRYWGCVGKVPMSVINTMKIDVEVALIYRRAARRRFGLRSSARFGFWCFGYSVGWLRFVDEMQTNFEEKNIPENFPTGWYRTKKYEILDKLEEDE